LVGSPDVTASPETFVEHERTAHVLGHRICDVRIGPAIAEGVRAAVGTKTVG
jgi:hypothetical protein